MRILVACERFGRVRDAFRARGHDAWSCDRLPDVANSTFHIRGDCEWFAENIEPFDMLLAFPPCTYLCGSGIHWNKRRPERTQWTIDAFNFVTRLASIQIDRKAIENPVGYLNTHFRRPDQIIQPYWFGEDASKKTCLWLEGLPPLEPTKIIQPRIVNGRPRWANQTDSGQNRLGPSPTRSAERGRTYQGIANAMAEQWGSL
jgi:hypothetical protein